MKKKLVAALLCGAMAAGSITVYAETVHAEGDTTITVMASQDWVYDAEMELGKNLRKRPESRLIIRLSRLISITIC